MKLVAGDGAPLTLAAAAVDVVAGRAVHRAQAIVMLVSVAPEVPTPVGAGSVAAATAAAERGRPSP